VEVLKDFSPLLRDECFVAFQQQEEDVDWVTNGVMGARPGHPFLQACMRLTADAFGKKNVFLRSPARSGRRAKQLHDQASRAAHTVLCRAKSKKAGRVLISAGLPSVA
jgi:hypothetical protein